MFKRPGHSELLTQDKLVTLPRIVGLWMSEVLEMRAKMSLRGADSSLFILFTF